MSLIFEPSGLRATGSTMRRESMRASDSTRTTSAPKAASVCPAMGPAPNQEKSATRTPSRGREGRLAARAGRAGAALQAASGCSPRRGGGATAAGVAERR